MWDWWSRKSRQYSWLNTLQYNMQEYIKDSNATKKIVKHIFA